MSKLNDYTSMPLSARIAIYRLLLDNSDGLTSYNLSKEVGVPCGAWLGVVANRPLVDEPHDPDNTKYIRRKSGSLTAQYIYYIPLAFRANARALVELYDRQQAAANFCYQHEDTDVSTCPSNDVVEDYEFEPSGHYSGMPFDQLVYSALELEAHQRKLLVRILSRGE